MVTIKTLVFFTHKSNFEQASLKALGQGFPENFGS